MANLGHSWKENTQNQQAWEWKQSFQWTEKSQGRQS